MPRIPQVKLDRASYASIAVMITSVIVMLRAGQAGGLPVYIGGMTIAIISFIIAFIRPFLTRYISTPRVDLDLVYALVHMRLVASGKPSAGKVLEAVSDQNLYGKYSITMHKAAVLAKEWGYNLSEALTYLAKSIKETTFKEVVQRLAATIKLGADLESFLQTEFNTLFQEYRYSYSRTIENMRVLLGVYVAVLAALVFALSSFMLLGFFFGGANTALLQAYIAGLVAMITLGGIIIYILPKEYFDIKGREARENRLILVIDVLAVLGLIVGLALAYSVARQNPNDIQTLSKATVIAGLFMIPAGLVSLVHESRVQNVDTFFPVFVRSLGSFLETIPSLKYAIKQVLRTDLGRLSKMIKRFHTRLENEIPPQIVWKRFAIESGSELVRRGARIFQDTAEYGGNKELAGVIISDFNNSLLSLRRQRAQIASNFTTTAIIIYATVVLITIFVVGLMEYFNDVLNTLLSGLSADVSDLVFIKPIDLDIINKTIYLFLIALAVVNAILIAKVRPYSLRTFWLFMGIMLIVTGVSAYASSVSVKFVMETMSDVTPNIPLP